MFHIKNILNQMMRLSLLASMGFAVFLYGASPASAQVLGAAQSFVVLGGSSVSFAGSGNVMTGDVGVSTGTSVTGSYTVTVPFGTHNNDGVAVAAQTSTTALYVSLTPGACASPSNPQLSAATFTPGTYCFSSSADLATTGVLTLDGAGTYIFQVGSTLTANTLSHVILKNGADACNVFWQVTAAATLNGVNFEGTVVSNAAVTLGVGAILHGRALTTIPGAVTLSGSNTAGGCSVPGQAVTPFLALTTLSRTGALLPGTVGTPMTDSKTLSGGLGSAAPTGTIIFSLYSDLSCTTSVFTSLPVTVTGNGSFTTPPFTPTVPGTFHWRATYSGDPNNAPTTTACDDANEIVIVSGRVIPPGAAAGIPTLSGWGLMTLMALIGVASIYRLRRI
jgi:hypothetical protein